MSWRNVLRFSNVVSIFRRNRALELPPRILFVTEGQTACSELVTAPLIALQAEGKIRLTVAFEHDYRGAQLRRLTRTDCDLLIVFRASTRRGLRTFRAAKRAGKRTVWASDDDLLSLDATNPVGSRYQRPKVRKTINTMMHGADALWTFSSAMAEKYRSLDSKRFVIVIRLLHCAKLYRCAPMRHELALVVFALVILVISLTQTRCITLLLQCDC